MRWPFRWRGNPDPGAFFAELSASHPGKQYARADKYRDFRAVFQNSEQGRRVLHEILTWCHIGHASAPQAKFQTNETMYLDGQRSVGIKLMVIMNAEPKDKPTSTKEK